MQPYLPNDTWMCIIKLLKASDAKSLLQSCKQVSLLKLWVMDLLANKADALFDLLSKMSLGSGFIRQLSHITLYKLVRERDDLESIKLYKRHDLDEAFIDFALTKGSFGSNFLTNFEKYAVVIDVNPVTLERYVKLFRPEHHMVLNPYQRMPKWYYQNIHDACTKAWSLNVYIDSDLTYTEADITELLNEIKANMGLDHDDLGEFIRHGDLSVQEVLSHPSITLDRLERYAKDQWTISDELRFKEGFEMRHFGFLLRHTNTVLAIGDCHLLPNDLVKSVLTSPIGCSFPISLQACGHCPNVPLEAFIKYLVTNNLSLRKDELAKLLIKRVLTLEDIEYLWSIRSLMNELFKSKFWKYVSLNPSLKYGWVKMTRTLYPWELCSLATNKSIRLSEVLDFANLVK